MPVISRADCGFPYRSVAQNPMEDTDTQHRPLIRDSEKYRERKVKSKSYKRSLAPHMRKRDKKNEKAS
jgi:hypothetical protein